MTDFEFEDRVELRQKRDFGEKMNATFEFLQKNSRPLYRAIILIILPIAFLGGIAAGFMNNQIGDLGKMLATGDTSAILTNANEIFNFAYFMTVILSLVGGLVSIALVLSYIKLYLNNPDKEITLEELKSVIISNTGKLFLGMLILVLAIVAIVVVMALVAQVPYLGPMVIFVAFFAFMYATITIQLTFPIMILEDKGVIESISRSFYLISGKWWSTFGLLFILGTIVNLITIVFSIPLFSLNAFLAYNGIDSEVVVRVVNVIGNIITNVGNYAAGPIVIIGASLQYFNLVELKEAKGLISKIESMGQQNTEDAPEETY